MKAIIELLSILLGCGLIFYGTSKVTANFQPQLHEYLKGEFGKLNKVFPLYAFTGFRPYARTYRCVFGLLEIIAGSILVGGKSCTRHLAVMLMFMMHSFILYSLYALGEPVNEKYYVQGALTLSLFLLYSLMGYSCRPCSALCGGGQEAAGYTGGGHRSRRQSEKMASPGTKRHHSRDSSRHHSDHGSRSSLDEMGEDYSDDNPTTTSGIALGDDYSDDESSRAEVRSRASAASK